MIFRLLFPEELAGSRIECVEPARLVAEEEHVAAAVAYGQNRCAHRAGGLIHPSDAACLRIEIVNGAARAAHKEIVVENGGLRERGDIARVGERPFELAGCGRRRG